MSKSNSANNVTKALQGGHKINVPDVKVNVQYPELNNNQPEPLRSLVLGFESKEAKKGGAA